MIAKVGTRLISLIAAAFLSSGVSRAAMAPLTLAEIDWSAAAASLQLSQATLEQLRSLNGFKAAAAKQGGADYLDQPFGKDLQTINAVASILRPEVHAAGSPVLLPMDLTRLTTGMIEIGKFLNKEKTSAYFGGMESLAFHPGPYGYRAYFRLKKTSTVMVSGSRIFYDLVNNPKLPAVEPCTSLIQVARNAAGGNDDAANKAFFDYLAKYEKKVGAVAAEYFGETEAAVPCSFAGALIEVHILCDSIGDPTCKVKDQARSIISKLAFAGGAPRPKEDPELNDPIHRLRKLVSGLESESDKKAAKAKLPKYEKPGDLVSGTGVDGEAGSIDYGVFGPILFPTDMSAFAQTVVYRQDESCLVGDEDKGKTCIHNGIAVTKAPIGEWRDNFCEDRSGNNLYTCPAGHGHAGQDIWGKNWKPDIYLLRAVTDGIAFRRFPAQPAVTVSDVNGTNIDYIYRHMRPSRLTEHGIGPGKPQTVKRGCTLALVDRLQGLAKDEDTPFKDNGLSYVATASHLHFEIRVPTRSGYQHVSPYWTVAQAHKFAATKVDTAVVANGPCGAKK